MREICQRHGDEVIVIHERWTECPLCKALEKIDELKATQLEIDTTNENLQELVDELKEELDGLKYMRGDWVREGF